MRADCLVLDAGRCNVLGLNEVSELERGTSGGLMTYGDWGANIGRVEDSEKLLVDDKVGEGVIGVEDRAIGAIKVQGAFGGIKSLAKTGCAPDNVCNERGRVGRRLEGHEDLEGPGPACVADDDRIALHDGRVCEKQN